MPITTPIGHDERRMVRVWDPLVRWVHWVLVALFTIAFVSGEGDGAAALHRWAGYGIGGVLVLRVLWGFIGTRHARFTDFLYSPATGFIYLADLVRGRARRYLGHSPAGAIMVFVLLILLAATVVTGIMVDSGPGDVPSVNQHVSLTVPTYADEKGSSHANSLGSGEQEAESTLGELHETLANLTLVLVLIHILGVGLASISHRENLVRAMITGKKRAG